MCVCVSRSRGQCSKAGSGTGRETHRVLEDSMAPNKGHTEQGPDSTVGAIVGGLPNPRSLHTVMI